jgi:sugar lactone lactonase YvrE
MTKFTNTIYQQALTFLVLFTHKIFLYRSRYIPTGIAFNTDGTKMFITWYYRRTDSYEYDLSTGFDVSSAAYLSNFSVALKEHPAQD